MKYPNITEGVFVRRLNRFAADVTVDGVTQKCHVKNTGRLRELLSPGAVCYLTKSENPARQTRYDLVAVEKEGKTVNIDSMAPNAVAGEYLKSLYPDAEIHREVRFGDSRLDFMVKREEDTLYVEVKGVTLLEEGTALFPDAPTERGVKHLRELIGCVQQGHHAMILFAVTAPGAQRVVPNAKTHAAFAKAMEDAEKAGVSLRAVACTVLPDTVWAEKTLPVALKL